MRRLSKASSRVRSPLRSSWRPTNRIVGAVVGVGTDELMRSASMPLKSTSGWIPVARAIVVAANSLTATASSMPRASSAKTGLPTR